jgi:hypothetical protein
LLLAGDCANFTPTPEETTIQRQSLGAIKTSQLLPMTGYNPHVIAGMTKTSILTLLSQRKLALTATNMNLHYKIIGAPKKLTRAASLS